MASNDHAKDTEPGSSAGRKKNASTYAKNGARGVRRRGTGEGEVTDGQFAAERSSLITERQSELEGILDRHDTLLRESFQLEQFRTIVLYDPTVAKSDTSAVWQEYKAKHDLLQQTPNEGTSSRTTRRAHTERLQILKGPSAASQVSIDKAPPTNKAKSENNALWSILYEGKGKGKDKATNFLPERVRQKAAGKEKSNHSTSRPSRAVAFDPLSYPINDSVSQGGPGPSLRPPHIGPGRPLRKRTSGEFEQSQSISLNGHLEGGPPSRKKRRKEDPLALNGHSSSSHPRRVSSQSASSNPRLGRELKPRAVTNGISHHHVAPASPIKSGITKVKLIVRKPPPSITHPRQKPPPPKFGKSLHTFLSSYHSIDDQDLSEAALDEQARRDAAIIDRIEDLRQQGRLLPEVDEEAEPRVGISNTASGTEHQRGPDLWDHVIQEVVSVARAKRRGGSKSGGKHVAAQIAKMVQAYWDGTAMKEDRAKAQEERRLRALAKATIKMVTSEWKKAVFHIREQERLRLEAEERKRGQSHLDAILNQSGHILETQQGELARGDQSRSRSRSSSISANMRDWDEDEEDSAEDDEDDDEEEEEEEEGGGADDVDEHIPGADQEDSLGGRGDKADNSHQDEDDNTERGLEHEAGDMMSEEKDEELMYPPSDSQEGEPEDPLEDVETSHSPDSDLPDDDDDLELAYPTEDESEHRESSPQVPTDMTALEHLDMSVKRTSPSMSSVRHTPGPLAQIVTGPSSPLANAGSGSSEAAAAADDNAILSSNHTPLLNESAAKMSLSADGALELREPHIDQSTTPSAPLQSSLAVTIEGLPQEDHEKDTVPIDDLGEQLDENDGEPSGDHDQDADADEGEDEDEKAASIPEYLRPFAVAPVDFDTDDKVRVPILLRGTLRPYQQSGLEWLASLHTNNLNGILADEMGLGKTIQTISLLAHLACDRGIWGPHLIIVPTSVLLNWEMEFKKFLPGFKTLSYHGTTKRRKELRQGWNDKHHFNVCITSYTLASRDAHIFKRKAWYYMILDEAHMIKNFKSQRWNILLMFRSFRRLLLTGTPLQNNLTELWALLQFLMSGTNFANLKEFGEWFSNPLEKAIEMGTMLDDENMQRVSKLHTVLRPYLLRRLKRDVEKELPSKYEHLVLCPLSKRQRFLYDEFMLRAQTRESLQSGVYQKIANILMQLRKVCNHPDLFEVRPIVTSFAMPRAAIADFEVQELLIRRHLLKDEDSDRVNLGVLGLRFIDRQATSIMTALETRYLDASSLLPNASELPGLPPPKDTRSIHGFKTFSQYQSQASRIARWTQIGYLNRLRCNQFPVCSQEVLTFAKLFYQPLLPLSAIDHRRNHLHQVNSVHSMVKSYSTRASELSTTVDKFAFVTPAVVALDMPRIALLGSETAVAEASRDPSIDAVLHHPSVKLQIAFPDPSLLQYDCGKLQELTRLLREKKAGGHRVLIFTQMTKILDILEIFLNFHGYLYLRLDGATKIEDRQYITERFNADPRVFCFIASSRSGGVGINLTGADTVVFYDSDFNPQMDRQCEDRAHRIGQIRDVHIYRFVSSHTVEEAMLLKANQKRSLDDLVIQKGEFDWRSLFGDESVLNKALDETALTKALGEVEDTEDAHAAAVAAREENVMEGADEADFRDADVGDVGDAGDTDVGDISGSATPFGDWPVEDDTPRTSGNAAISLEGEGEEEDEDEDEGGTTVDYMLDFIRLDEEFFEEWRV